MTRRHRNSNPRPGELGRRVLGFLVAARGAYTSEEIAVGLGEAPRRVYAAMSSMGKYQGRHWIKPKGYWNRKTPFAATRAGRIRISSL